MTGFRMLAHLLSPAGGAGRMSVLIFHRVRAIQDPFVPHAMDAGRFEQLLSWVSGCFNVLPADEAVAGLRKRNLPARALAITFDDGYADNAEVALPILRRHQMSATFFIATDFLDGGMMWNDSVTASIRDCAFPDLDLEDVGLGRHELGSVTGRRRAVGHLLSRIKYMPATQRADVVAAINERSNVVLSRDLMMRSDQVRALRDAGMVIGGHTCSHPILANVPSADAEREIADGKDRLESIIGEPVSLFAYPNGTPCKDYSMDHVRMVRRIGFDAAFSTASGTSSAKSDLFQLPRFTPWGRDRRRFLFRMVKNMLRSRPAAA